MLLSNCNGVLTNNVRRPPIQVLSTAPDVPHAVNVFTVGCTEGSGVGFKKEPPVLSGANVADLLSHDLAIVGEVALEFVFDVGDKHEVRWETTVLTQGRLLISLSSTALPDGSKDSFVRLLEFAEEHLGCREIYVEFPKESPDRPHLIRTFMFFGFSVLAPDTTPFPVDPNSITMVYFIE